MGINLKGKKVIITAGPTWVRIDSVRVISNIASGETGILLAEKFNKLGAKVTLLLGPVGRVILGSRIKVVNFKFFEDLRALLTKELRLKKYDIALHSAAVSDYRPAVVVSKKINSGLRNLKISLGPTPKIIDIFKKIQPDIFLVGFKFEPHASRPQLLKESQKQIVASGADLVVANTTAAKGYAAYLVYGDNCRGPFFTKAAMVTGLTKVI
ncbi:MAG: phosphopantothenoylcysteine decarboxylase [Candidatus Omnitrophica bacterium]|nr:phosphopantothenoylcysteine decarboxylase [Candidatus Omnitrophota bacterium]MDD3987903.1 phosphopantothenoylcysteine decarboxylase [Candidatus Omnitrophota bacterium]MDD4981952.1 phosphopantothenoylcysteine decarboxylase [Candidatus Omnitrophota bacterium]MDD5665471.1 phosphopantothenoylcysteine decarboxylase [Candidatus Omnitrophota bacterium]